MADTSGRMNDLRPSGKPNAEYVLVSGGGMGCVALRGEVVCHLGDGRGKERGRRHGSRGRIVRHIIDLTLCHQRYTDPDRWPSKKSQAL